MVSWSIDPVTRERCRDGIHQSKWIVLPLSPYKLRVKDFSLLCSFRTLQTFSFYLRRLSNGKQTLRSLYFTITSCCAHVTNDDDYVVSRPSPPSLPYSGTQNQEFLPKRLHHTFLRQSRPGHRHPYAERRRLESQGKYYPGGRGRQVVLH